MSFLFVDLNAVTKQIKEEFEGDLKSEEQNKKTKEKESNGEDNDRFQSLEDLEKAGESTALNYSNTFGTGKMVAETILGKDLITNEKIPIKDRVLNVGVQGLQKQLKIPGLEEATNGVNALGDICDYIAESRKYITKVALGKKELQKKNKNNKKKKK